MSKLKLVVAVLVLLFVTGLGFWIGVDNTELVSPRLLGFDMPEWSLGAWLTLMLFGGVLLGFAVATLNSLKIRARNRNLQRKLKKWEQGGSARSSG